MPKETCKHLGRYECAVSYAEACMASHRGWCCTLPRNHAGNHKRTKVEGKGWVLTPIRTWDGLPEVIIEWQGAETVVYRETPQIWRQAR